MNYEGIGIQKFDLVFLRTELQFAPIVSEIFFIRSASLIAR